MAYSVNIQNTGSYPVNPALLEQAVQIVLMQQHADSDSAVTIVLTDDAQVAALNEQFRGIAAPTDVLSFPADTPPIELDDEPPYLGDLVVAYPYAETQAQQAGHALQDSLALLVIHGTLHLLGYDHDSAERRAAMWAAQETALKALNISPEIVPPLEDMSHGDEESS